MEKLTFRTCGICLAKQIGVICHVCGAIQVSSKEYRNRLTGREMVRGIPMPLTVRIERAAKRVGAM